MEKKQMLSTKNRKDGADHQASTVATLRVGRRRENIPSTTAVLADGSGRRRIGGPPLPDPNAGDSQGLVATTRPSSSLRFVLVLAVAVKYDTIIRTCLLVFRTNAHMKRRGRHSPRWRGKTKSSHTQGTDQQTLRSTGDHHDKWRFRSRHRSSRKGTCSILR